jgi:photosystem II stability/assembly factor-like uncharacterized protein
MKKILFLIFLQLSVFSCQYCFGQWEKMNCPADLIYCIAIRDSNIFTGTKSGIYLSKNNGITWTSVNNGLLCDTVLSIAIKDSNIYAGTCNGLFLSTNNGSDWLVLNNGFKNISIWSIIVKDSNIFIGFGGSKGVYLSTNLGKTWKARNYGLPLSSPALGDIYSLTFCGTSLLAGTNNGYYITYNLGNDWTQGSGFAGYMIESFVTKDDKLFAADESCSGVYLTTNCGDTWSKMNNGLPDTFVSKIALCDTSIIACIHDGHGYSKGVYLTTNNGTYWYNVSEGLSLKSLVWSLEGNNKYIFAGTWGDGIWRRSIADFGLKVKDISNTNLKFQIYPNPTSNYLNLKSQNTKPEKYILTIMNIEGQEVLSKNVEFRDSYKLELPELRNGIYFLSLQNDKENYNTKLVIEK